MRRPRPLPKWALAVVMTLSLLTVPAAAQPEPTPEAEPPPTEAPADEPETEADTPAEAPSDAPTEATEPAPTGTSSVALPGLPPASEDIATQQAEAGTAFYRAGNYVSALTAFKAAFQVTPTAALSYNIARCHERLSQWEEAIEWYTRYTQMETDPRERADALDKIALLKTRTGGSSPENPDQFKARMESGRRAYSRGDFEGAIEDFKEAFDVRPEAAPLYNIAKSYEKMARYEDALDFYQQYLDIDPNASDKADVEAIMDRLRRDRKARFQELSVDSNPPGADVYLDDRNDGIIGQTNLRTKLRPGPHTLYIDLNGYEPVRRDFVMPDDKPLALQFELDQLENVGYVTIDVDQAGARIFLDGAIVGLSPFTQKKALPAGEHQIQVELVGYNRFAETFEVARDSDQTLQVRLDKYNPPISDGTLSDWGRNLLIFGLVGGGLGFGGPIVYQEFILNRPYFDNLGPEAGNGRPYYDGTPNSLRQNEELETLETVQMVSLIAGGTLVVTGLGFYMFKWFRTTPPPPVTAGVEPPPGLEITGLGVAPSADGGATIGLTGRF